MWQVGILHNVTTQNVYQANHGPIRRLNRLHIASYKHMQHLTLNSLCICWCTWRHVKCSIDMFILSGTSNMALDIYLGDRVLKLRYILHHHQVFLRHVPLLKNQQSYLFNQHSASTSTRICKSCTHIQKILPGKTKYIQQPKYHQDKRLKMYFKLKTEQILCLIVQEDFKKT